MHDETTIETIKNLLMDFIRGFEKDVRRLYKPYKYKKDDVLPAWRSAFCRQNKAVAFRDECISYFFKFIETSLPSVDEFCPGVREFFETKHKEVKAVLSGQLENVVLRRSSYDPDVVRSGIMLSYPVICLPVCPRFIKEMSLDKAVIKSTLISMKTFANLMRNADDCLQNGGANQGLP